MEDKKEKNDKIEEKINSEEIKENIETKAESENENETKDNNKIQQEIKEENKETTTESNIEINQEDSDLNNNIPIYEEKEEKINININNKESEKQNENSNNNKKQENNINIQIDQKVDNKEIISIKQDEPEEKKEDNSELKNIILNEKGLDQLNENDPLFNNEEKENSDEDEPEYSKNDIEGLYLRTKSNKAMKIEQFYEQKRHYFIMTEGGTPIYSRYGDEIKNCSLLATFSAIITKFTIFNNEKNSQEKLNYVCNDNSIIAF